MRRSALGAALVALALSSLAAAGETSLSPPRLPETALPIAPVEAAAASPLSAAFAVPATLAPAATPDAASAAAQAGPADGTSAPAAASVLFDNSRSLEELVEPIQAPASFHPDAIWPYGLRPGDTVFIAPGAFDAKLRRRLGLDRPLEMKVAAVRRSNKKRVWRADQDVIYLDSKRTGRVGLSAFTLIGDVYSRGDFAERSPYRHRQLVQIGYSFQTSMTLKTPRGVAVSFEGNTVPYIGSFSGVANDDNYLVTVRPPGRLHVTVLVPKRQVAPLTFAARKAAQEAFLPVLSQRLSFEPGERVRYRDEDGLMREGTYPPAGARIGNIFKRAGPEAAFTPFFHVPWKGAPLGKPSGFLAQFLDGGALITSRADFAQLPSQRKLLTLVRYAKRHLPWTAAAKSAELAGLDDFDKILGAGVGVCRHNALLLAALLTEAGFRARVAVAANGKDGHAWVEADMPERGGRTRTYLLDASVRDTDFVMPLGEVLAEAARPGETTRQAWLRRWYIRPDREYVSVSAAEPPSAPAARARRPAGG